MKSSVVHFTNFVIKAYVKVRADANPSHCIIHSIQMVASVFTR